MYNRVPNVLHLHLSLVYTPSNLAPPWMFIMAKMPFVSFSNFHVPSPVTLHLLSVFLALSLRNALRICPSLGFGEPIRRASEGP